MKHSLIATLALVSNAAIAGGFSASAVPTGIDVVQSGSAGFMLYGEFGNVAGCSVGNQLFIKASHPQYNQLYATALAAFSAGKRIHAYVASCEPVGWYSGSSVTYNIVNEGASLSIRE